MTSPPEGEGRRSPGAPALSEHRWLRLATLCGLYLAQGMPWGFVTFTVAAHLAAQGLDAASVGAAMALSTLPWTFKFLWGPVIDRLQLPALGRRRPWILLAQAMMALTIFAMLATPDVAADVELLGLMVFVHNLFNALQDVAVDALAVDLLPEEERGLANGLMYGSKYLGGAIGGAGLAAVMASAGIRGAIATQGLLLGLIFLLPLFLKERPGDSLWPWSPKPGAPPPAGGVAPSARVSAADVVDTRELLRTLLAVFRLRSNLLGALLAVLSSAGSGALGVIGTVFFVQSLGWEATDYAGWTGGPALFAGLAGAIFGGWLADRVGRRRAVGGAMVLLGLTRLGFGLAAAWWGDVTFVKAFLVLDSALQSTMVGAMFALYMDLSLPAVAATQFTAFMSLLNLGSVAGQGGAGWLERAFDNDYGLIFAAAGAVTALAAGLLPGIDPGQTRRALGTEARHPPGGPG